MLPAEKILSSSKELREVGNLVFLFSVRVLLLLQNMSPLHTIPVRHKQGGTEVLIEQLRGVAVSFRVVEWLSQLVVLLLQEVKGQFGEFLKVWGAPPPIF